MSDEVTALKKKLVESWRNLQDTSKSKNERTGAYENVVVISNEIRKVDKSFSLDEKALEKYSEFKPKNAPQLDKKVKWTDKNPLENLEKTYDLYVATAKHIVSKRLPNEDTDTDKFGTIVNATTANLIQIGLIEQLNELTGTMANLQKS